MHRFFNSNEKQYRKIKIKQQKSKLKELISGEKKLGFTIRTWGERKCNAQ